MLSVGVWVYHQWKPQMFHITMQMTCKYCKYYIFKNILKIIWTIHFYIISFLYSPRYFILFHLEIFSEEYRAITTLPRPSVAKKGEEPLTRYLILRHWETFTTLRKILPPNLSRAISTLTCWKSRFSNSQKVWVWGPVICVSTSLVGNSDAS